MAGDFASSQAIATCITLTPCAAATCSSALPFSLVLVTAAFQPRGRAARERCPWDEGEPFAGAHPEHVLGAAIGEVVTILHRCDRHDAPGSGELLGIEVRHTDVADLALLPQARELAEGILERHLGIDVMELVQVDARELQSLEAPLASLAQVLGPSVRDPLRRARTQQTAFGRDDEAARVRREALRDQPLADLGPVGIGGIDEVDAELERATQHAARLGRILRLTPDAGTCDPHGAKSHAIHHEITADLERARCRSESLPRGRRCWWRHARSSVTGGRRRIRGTREARYTGHSEDTTHDHLPP